ncbi:hypothetical protein E8E12_005573 [Didymella heteroderae]|uniref:Uncharacterized protein n=1 Tax=Didymella heteroderae TaxID=1769908 RepID=A0A9P4WL04_9PLEO|nr:hypothetical protein E8E12_005573 [Didymella heteroderae]
MAVRPRFIVPDSSRCKHTSLSFYLPSGFDLNLKDTIQQGLQAGYDVENEPKASSNTILLQVLNEMDGEGALKLDIPTHIVQENEWLPSENRESLEILLGVANQYASEHIDTRFVKFMMDGVPLPRLFTHAGLNIEGNIDHDKNVPENVADVVLRYDKKGFTIKIRYDHQRYAPLNVTAEMSPAELFVHPGDSCE